MNLAIYSLSLFALIASQPASADLISPQVEEAQRRLQANPNTYDRVDNFCKDKKPGASCTMPGTTFEGGGEGVCQTRLSSNESTIEMSCIRQGEVFIDRQIPHWNLDGASRGSSLGSSRGVSRGASRGESTEDQFCRGKVIGATCTLELRYLGNTEHPKGICKQDIESRSHYGGRPSQSRQVLRCEPLTEVVHVFTPVSWHEKILP